MNIEILKKAGIDYEGGIKRFLDDSELYETVLKSFLSDNILERAEKAHADKDADALFACSHEAKGSCGNVNMTEVYRTACDLTEYLRSGGKMNETESRLFNAFKNAYTMAMEAIREADKANG